MQIEQAIWTRSKGWTCDTDFSLGRKAQLVFVFGSFDLLMNKGYFDFIKGIYPKAKITGCSTSGEIFSSQVYDGVITLTAVAFNSTQVDIFSTPLKDANDSSRAGSDLADKLPKKDLSHVMVLSEGLNINGSVLAEGLADRLSSDIAVTGGLAGDQGQFARTLVFTEEGPQTNAVSAVGFYGRKLKIGYGSRGGWTPFGLDRCITRSEGNILYELDGQPALSLYKKYLGDQAKDLPASGLLFPLKLQAENEKPPLVRSILGVNERDGSMIFAGNMPQGRYVRLMKANINKLVDGAGAAAEEALTRLGVDDAELGILISCVGRKFVLKQRVEEEVEIVKEKLGAKTCLTGFYSNGEICPCFKGRDICELHNQTMTVTTFSEE